MGLQPATLYPCRCANPRPEARPSRPAGLWCGICDGLVVGRGAPSQCSHPRWAIDRDGTCHDCGARGIADRSELPASESGASGKENSQASKYAPQEDDGGLVGGLVLSDKFIEEVLCNLEGEGYSIRHEDGSEGSAAQARPAFMAALYTTAPDVKDSSRSDRLSSGYDENGIRCEIRIDSFAPGEPWRWGLFLGWKAGRRIAGAVGFATREEAIEDAAQFSFPASSGYVLSSEDVGRLEEIAGRVENGSADPEASADFLRHLAARAGGRS